MNLKRILSTKNSDPGSITDMFLIPPLVLAMVVTFAVVLMINVEFRDSGFFNETVPGFTQANNMPQIGINMVTLFDKGMIFVIVSLILGSAILSSQIRTHPVFLIPAFLMTGLAVVVAAIYSNAIWEIANNPSLIPFTNDLTVTLFIVRNMPAIVLAGSIFIDLAMFARPSLPTPTGPTGPTQGGF